MAAFLLLEDGSFFIIGRHFWGFCLDVLHRVVIILIPRIQEKTNLNVLRLYRPLSLSRGGATSFRCYGFTAKANN